MQQSIRIAPSILAADFAALAEEIRAVTEAGADYIHIDVMDGHFVPNITLGPEIVAAIRRHSDLPFDVHLMVSPVDSFIEPFSEAGADIITVHPEAGPHLHRTIQIIKSCGKKAGVALNPSTPVAAALEVLEDVDLVLVMSVNPGFGGQDFIPGTIRKIRTLRKEIDACGRSVDLEVDGGVNVETASLVRDAGADVLVAGTATFRGGKEHYAQNIRNLRGGG